MYKREGKGATGLSNPHPPHALTRTQTPTPTPISTTTIKAKSLLITNQANAMPKKA